MSELTLETLCTLLTEVAGADEAIDMSEGVNDRTFSEMGYDSLALMELAARIERDYGVLIEDDQFAALETPGAVLDLVNVVLAKMP